MGHDGTGIIAGYSRILSLVVPPLVHQLVFC